MRYKNKKSENEEEIKINFFNKKKKAAMINSFILLAFFLGSYALWEYNNSQNRIILATTTSTYDSGLLDYLLPPFEEKYGINVEILSLGTGQAIETGEKGDADVLLVHARSLEDEFVDDDHGIHRVCVMYNDFLIIGPSSDPAGIKDKNVTQAMKEIKSAGESNMLKFYSRGDKSGTHFKELELWDLINYEPDPANEDWYFETGSGMGNTLISADNEVGYTLIDRGTWLSSKEKVGLIELVSGDDIFLNPYGAIAVNPKKHPYVKYDYAIALIAFLVSEEGQDLIADFRKKKEKLFIPCFGECDETHDCKTTEEEVDYWSEHNDGYRGSSATSSHQTRFS